MTHTAPILGSQFRPSHAATAPDLVDRLIAHDENAFRELVRLYGPRMLAVATRYLHRPADAEDALQDAFVSVVRSIARFQRASSLETWLHRIVVNCALMSLRRRRRKPELALEVASLEGCTALPGRCPPPPSAHARVEGAELADRIEVSMNLLPEAQRSVLTLRDVHSQGIRAIGELLGIGPATVKFRLRGARQAMRESLSSSPARPTTRPVARRPIPLLVM